MQSFNLSSWWFCKNMYLGQSFASFEWDHSPLKQYLLEVKARLQVFDIYLSICHFQYYNFTSLYVATSYNISDANDVWSYLYYVACRGNKNDDSVYHLMILELKMASIE